MNSIEGTKAIRLTRFLVVLLVINKSRLVVRLDKGWLGWLPSLGGPKQLGFKVSYWDANLAQYCRQEQPPEIKPPHVFHSEASSCSSRRSLIAFPTSTIAESLPQAAASPLLSSADLILQLLQLGGSLIQTAAGPVVAAELW